MTALSAPNGRKATDWLRPVPCQREGDKLPKGPYQSSDGYSTGVHLPGHLACDPSSWREASHVSSQGKEAVFVTHDIYIDPYLYMLLQGVLALQWGPFPICIPQFLLPIPFPCPIMVVLLPWFLLFLLDPSLVVPRKRSPETESEIGLEVGPETTLTIPPGDKFLDLLLLVVPFLEILSLSPYFPLGPTPPAFITQMIP